MTPLTRIRPALAADGALYFDETRGLHEALIPTAMPSNHANGLLELPDGEVLCVWFAGSDEGNPDIAIWQSRLDPATGVWSPAEQLTDDPDRSDQNPSLFRTPDGELWLLYASQLARRPDRHETFNLQHTAELRRKRSSDNGHTWSEHEVLFERPGTFARQPVQVLSNGRWIFPTWISFDDGNKNASDVTVMQVSDDEGVTWRAIEVPRSAGCVHANVVELEPGQLVALYRSRYADHIYLSTSHDFGDTWSAPGATELPNNNSSIAAARLPGGRLGVVFNDIGFNRTRSQVFWPYERPSVTLAASADAGRTFPWRRVVETGDAFTGDANLRANHRHEYPSMLVATDGRVHIAYSFHTRECMKHVIVDEAWLDGELQVITGDCKLWS